ncbi:hypothetical protein [Methanobrevibacter sp.]
MNRPIWEYPPVERPYVAVRRYRLVLGETIFTDLLNYLDLDYEAFVRSYGEKLVRDPNCLSKKIVEMQTSEWKKSHDSTPRGGRGHCLN